MQAPVSALFSNYGMPSETFLQTSMPKALIPYFRTASQIIHLTRNRVLANSNWTRIIFLACSNLPPLMYRGRRFDLSSGGHARVPQFCLFEFPVDCVHLNMAPVRVSAGLIAAFDSVSNSDPFKETRGGITSICLLRSIDALIKKRGLCMCRPITFNRFIGIVA
jgi:hypothetical protein